MVERECEILKQLNHPNIVQQVEVAWRSHKVKIYMEYCEGGSLQDLINDRKKEGTLLSEKYVWTVAYQLASALLYCHFGLRVNDEGHVSSDPNNILPWTTILHRDIKPANVFMMNHSETALDSIKLGDFGLGYVLQNDDHPGTYVGTAQFLAPEISRLSADPIRWTTDCDMFSFGCTLYTLCKLRPPFANHLEAENQSYPPIPDIYTSQLRDLIASCLSFSPDARPRNVLDLFQQCRCRVLCPRVEGNPIPDISQPFQPRVLHLRDECKPIPVPLPTQLEEFKRESRQLQAHIERTRQKGVQDPMLLGSDKSRNKNPSTGNTLVKLNDSILVEQVIAQVEQVIAKAEQVIAEADEREQGRIAASNHLERTRPVAAADQQVHMTATVLAKTDEPITVSNRDETPSTCQIM